MRSDSRSGNRFFTSGMVVSLRQIIKINWSILNDQIFQIDQKQGGVNCTSEPVSKFVMLKVTKVEEEGDQHGSMLI